MDFGGVGDALGILWKIAAAVGALLLFGPLVVAGLHAVLNPHDSAAQGRVAEAGANAIADAVTEPFQLLLWAGAIGGPIALVLVGVWLYQQRGGW